MIVALLSVLEALLNELLTAVPESPAWKRPRTSSSEGKNS
jgi:hypothetical protein